MPQEYKHSMPNGAPELNLQGYLLYLLPSPLIIKLVVSLFAVNIPKLAFTAAALFFFYSGAHLTRTTLLRLKNQPANRQHKVKDNRMWGGIYTAVGVLILMFMMRRPFLMTVVMTSSAFIGYYLCYGFSTPKQQPSVDYSAMPKATQDAIQGAYQDLETIEELGDQLNLNDDKQLAETLEKVIDQSYVIMDLLVESPKDAGRARRFLNVYINRIKEILQQYITLSKHGNVDHLRERLVTTLNEVEVAFREKKSQLLDDDMLTLDVQLEVLDEQIKNEE